MMLMRVAVAAIIAFVTPARLNVYAGDVSYDQMPPNYHALMKMTPADQMRLMDPSKKGYVTKDEFMKFHQRMAEKAFDNMDKNHDGKLTQAEFEEAQRVEAIHTLP